MQPALQSWNGRAEIFGFGTLKTDCTCERQHLLLSLDLFAACWVNRLVSFEIS